MRRFPFTDDPQSPPEVGITGTADLKIRSPTLQAPPGNPRFLEPIPQVAATRSCDLSEQGNLGLLDTGKLLETCRIRHAQVDPRADCRRAGTRGGDDQCPEKRQRCRRAGG
jgi:hypothetical protein